MKSADAQVRPESRQAITQVPSWFIPFVDDWMDVRDADLGEARMRDQVLEADSLPRGELKAQATEAADALLALPLVPSHVEVSERLVGLVAEWLAACPLPGVVRALAHAGAYTAGYYGAADAVAEPFRAAAQTGAMERERDQGDAALPEPGATCGEGAPEPTDADGDVEPCEAEERAARMVDALCAAVVHCGGVSAGPVREAAERDAGYVYHHRSPGYSTTVLVVEVKEVSP